MISKRGKNFWLDIWVGKKRVRRSLRTDEYHLAIERAHEISAQLKAGPIGKGLSFRDFSARYLEWARQTKMSSYAAESYRIKIIQSWLDTAGISSLNEITPWHVEQLRAAIRTRDRRIKDKKKEREASRSTANRYCALLRTMFNRARDWGMFAGENPVSKVKFFRESTKVQPLKEKEIRSVLEAADALSAIKHATPLQREAPAIFRFVLNTGLRRSEVFMLRWSDVGDDALTVRGKGEKVRTVPINAEAAAILAGRKRQGVYVFDVPYRTSPSLMRRLTETISKKAGVHFHLHLLRHAFASRLLAEGIDIVTIGDLLGHSAAMTTLLYSHSSATQLKRAVDTLVGHRHIDVIP